MAIFEMLAGNSLVYSNSTTGTSCLLLDIGSKVRLHWELILACSPVRRRCSDVIIAATGKIPPGLLSTAPVILPNTSGVFIVFSIAVMTILCKTVIQLLRL